MKGKTLILAGLVCSVSLLSGCAMFGWFGSSADPAPTSPPVEVEAPADPTPPPAPVPAKPLTAKERKAQAALEKKQADEARKAGKRDSADVVQKRLDDFARGHLVRANESLRPNKTHMEVRREGSQYCVFYSEVDLVTLKTELYPSNKPGAQYVGHVVYIENTIAAYGTTEKAARNGVFKQIKSKRIRELTRYDAGKWHY